MAELNITLNQEEMSDISLNNLPNPLKASCAMKSTYFGVHFKQIISLICHH